MGNDGKCRSSRNPSADTSGPNTPISQKLGLTAAPVKPVAKSRPRILEDTEALLAVIDDSVNIREVK